LAEKDKSDRIRAFYRDLCLSFAGCIRSLTLYPEDHPETRKKLDSFFTRVTRYCEKRPGLSILFLGGEVIVENNRLPELSKTLGRLISRFEEMRFQRLVFRRGLTEDELILFLQLLLPLIKKPSGADLVLAKNQERLPHIIAGALPFEAGPQVTYEELSGAIEAARDSVLSFSSRIKDLLDHVDGPLSAQKTATAKEVTEAVRKRILSGEIPLKVLIYRRSSDPDPYLHAVNVAVLSMALAEQFKIEESVIREIGLSALVHDIGLYGGTHVDFNKSASLTLDEKRLRWEHPVRGAQILMASPGLPDMVPIVAYEHHLHFDGSGYPRQKVSRDLNMASMIVCIANSYDNLRRNRPESGAVSLTEALNWMDRRLGTFFHPLLFKQFRAMVKAQAREAV
jgi:HD-GYP domain-containing protein (c-di-GMP phosphodiesterase class II)